MTPRYSPRFYFGIILVTISLIMGKITTVLAVTFWTDPFIRYLSLILYIISWPILILGAYWTGQEYMEKMRKYSSASYYKDAVKKQASIAYAKSNTMRSHVKETHTKIKGKLTATKAKLKTRVTETKNKVKGKVHSLRTHNKKQD